MRINPAALGTATIARAIEITKPRPRRMVVWPQPGGLVPFCTIVAQHEGVLLPDVDRAPLQGPFASSPGFAVTDGSLLSPIPGLLPFPKPAVMLGVVPLPGDD